jgi:hypothetical protein
MYTSGLLDMVALSILANNAVTLFMMPVTCNPEQWNKQVQPLLGKSSGDNMSTECSE